MALANYYAIAIAGLPMVESSGWKLRRKQKAHVYLTCLIYVVVLEKLDYSA